MEDNKKESFPQKGKRKTSRSAILSIVIATLMLLVFMLGFVVRGATEHDYARKINEIIKLIDNTSVYYDEKTADAAINGFVKTLLTNDKYAAYYSPEEYSRILAEDTGKYSGVGLGFIKNGGDYDGTIGRVYLNSPAHKCGIQTGDKLVAGIFKGQSDYAYFAGLQGEDKTVLQVISEFFSEFGVGEEIKIKVVRGGEETEFTLEKAEYVASYVEYKDDEKSCYFSTETGDFVNDGSVLETLSQDTAYIKLHEFEGGAASQFGKAIEYMKSRGKTKLIIDLRDNGGGQITVLSDILSYIINDNGANNVKIMNVKEKNSESSFSTSKNRYNAFLTDIAVIANCGSASASEALINALNDYGDRIKYKGAEFNLGRLILTQQHEIRQTYCTFGKGIMQTTYGLMSGGALVLTTAYVYSPLSNKCIQDIGIETTDAANCVIDENAIARADAVLH